MWKQQHCACRPHNALEQLDDSSLTTNYLFVCWFKDFTILGFVGSF